MATKSEQIKHELDRLVGATGEIQGAFLARDNGLLISTSHSYDQKKAQKEAAQAAILFTYAKRFSDGVENGGLQKVLVNGSDGDTIALPVTEDVFLVISASKDPMVGMVFIEAEAALKRIVETGLLD